MAGEAPHPEQQPKRRRPTALDDHALLGSTLDTGPLVFLLRLEAV